MKDCQERNGCEDCIEIDECEDYIPKFKEEVLECPCKNCTINCGEERLNCTVCENCAICVPQTPVHRVTDHSALADNEPDYIRQECANCTIPTDSEKQTYLEFCIMEEEIAKRTVLQHICEAFTFLAYKNVDGFKHEMFWALERFIRFGDYSHGGYFDTRGYDWR